MNGLNIIFMLLTALLAFKTIVKTVEIIKARDLVNRGFLIYAMLVAAMWWIFQKFGMTEIFFWRGLAGGIVFWTITLAAPMAEKFGDFICITRMEVAVMLAAVPALLTAGILLGLPILFTVLILCLSVLGIFVYFIVKNKMRARKYQKELGTDYAVLRKKSCLIRLKEEISSITDVEILERAIVKSKQRLLLSGKKCDFGNCRNTEGCCRFQGSVKLQSNDFIRGCELEQFNLDRLLSRKEELKTAKKRAV